MMNDIKVIIEDNQVITDSIQIQSVNYEGISNKPKINGIELIGDKTSADLGLDVDTSGLATKEELNTKQDKGDYALVSDIPTLVSQLENDKNYATSLDVKQAIASIPQFKLSIVNELPEVGEQMVLYLVPKEGTNNDVYNEYIWLANGVNAYEFLGTTAVDLTGYVKNTDYATSSVGGVIKIANNYYYGLALNSSHQLYIMKAPDAQVIEKENVYRPIVPANLDLAVKTGVTTNTLELTEAEKVTACNWLGTAKTLLITEDDYNALETKNTNTLYLIEEE